MKKLTQEEFVNRIKDRYGDEYQVLSQYRGASERVKIKHTCGAIKNIFPGNILYAPFRCKNCTRYRKYSPKTFSEELKKIDPNIVCVGKFITLKTDMTFYYLPDKKYFVAKPEEMLKKKGYPFSLKANGTRPRKGLNDLATTHSHIASLLQDPKDGEKYSFGTMEELVFICPHCKAKITKRPNQLLSKNGKVRCGRCSDGFKFPEKFVSCAFMQLGIDYVFQFSKRNASWCSHYRYDFYIREIDTIVEVNGSQHYKDKFFKTAKETQENDEKKEKLARGFVTDYIIINASTSTTEFLKNSLFESKLSDIYDFSKIDWGLCTSFGLNSMVTEVWKDWDNNLEVNDISNKYHICTETVRRYLRDAEAEHLLKRSYQQVSLENKANSKRKGKKVYCVELNKEFPSIKNAEMEFNKSPGNHTSISSVLSGKQAKAYGYSWKYVDEELEKQHQEKRRRYLESKHMAQERKTTKRKKEKIIRAAELWNIHQKLGIIQEIMGVSRSSLGEYIREAINQGLIEREEYTQIQDRQRKKRLADNNKKRWETKK